MNRNTSVRCLAFFSAVFLAGCPKETPPTVGAACRDEGRRACLTEQTAVSCEGGKWRFERCVSCQQATESMVGCVRGGIGAEGAPCEGMSVDCDGVDMVRCLDGKFRHFPCRGPRGCGRKMDLSPGCDIATAVEGEACFGDRVAGCGADAGAVLKCREGHFKLDRTCGGPLGCKVSVEGVVSCDTTVATLGAVCFNGGACDATFGSLLFCRDQKYVPYRICRGEQPGCEIRDKLVACKHPDLAEPGDPCVEEIVACSLDGKALLQCKDGSFARKKACRACAIKGTEVDCK